MNRNGHPLPKVVVAIGFCSDEYLFQRRISGCEIPAAFLANILHRTDHAEFAAHRGVGTHFSSTAT